MKKVLKVGDQVLREEDLSSLLAQYQMLPSLAQNILIDQVIAEVECTEEEKQQELNKFYQQNKITEEQLPEWLDRNHITKEQWEQLVLRKLKLDKFKQAHWGNKLEAYFLKRKIQLDRVVYSLFRTDDAGAAQEFYFRLQEEEITFKDLAQKYSKGTEAETGGLIGPVEVSVPHPRIAHILRTTKPGELVPPTPIENWWVIVRLENFLAAELDEPMQQRLLDEQFKMWLKEQLQEKVILFPEEEITTSLPEQTSKELQKAPEELLVKERTISQIAE